MTIAVVVAAMLALVCLCEFGLFTDTCIACGGKGEHRDGCPNE